MFVEREGFDFECTHHGCTPMYFMDYEIPLRTAGSTVKLSLHRWDHQLSRTDLSDFLFPQTKELKLQLERGV